MTTKVFYMTPKDASLGTLEWWKADTNRNAFLQGALVAAHQSARSDVVASMREYVDSLYNMLIPGEWITFYSDFPEFDIGMTSAILSEHGFFPLYLKNDESPPCMCVNYNTLLRGITHTKLSSPTKDAYAKAEIVRPVRSSMHDPVHDVKVIMREVEMVLGAL
jgi:hypothetical protein